MTREECAIGKVVRLAGGGPNLTINFVYSGSDLTKSQETYCVQCTWFDTNLEKHVDTFRPETLVPVEMAHPYR